MGWEPPALTDLGVGSMSRSVDLLVPLEEGRQINGLAKDLKQSCLVSGCSIVMDI